MRSNRARGRSGDRRHDLPAGDAGRGLGAAAKGSRLIVGGQDCHAKASGANTGDISAEMLADAGAKAVIVGHSERRMDHGELRPRVRAKAEAAHRAGLIAIICVGETAGERAIGLTLDVVGRQLAGSVPKGATAANTVIAYEPVWAIGTGLTPTAGDVAEVHQSIRETLGKQLRRGGRSDAPPLWRLGQGVERQGVDGGRQRRWRAGRRRQPQG